MKIGAIYIRKSVQTGRGDSIKNQIDLCKDYARNKNILIDNHHIYCDEGYSGKDFNRPGFKRMITDLKQHKFNVLICYRLDRISRSLNDFSNLSEILEKHRVSFVSVKELFDTSTSIGKSMMYIASVFAQLERETIAERVRDNISKLSRTGRWLGGVAPTGFKSIVNTYVDDDFNKKKSSKLSPIQSELYVVKILFNKFIDLKNLSSLAHYCDHENLKSKNNLLFSKTALKQILTNPVYSIADYKLYDYLNFNNFSISNKKQEFNGVNGVLLYSIDGENIISLAEHHGVIESKKWIEVQNILSKNKKKPYRQGTSSIGLMSGLIKCGNCGSLMRVKHGRKNANGISYYYVCTLKEKDKEKCDISNLNGIDTDSSICKQINNNKTQKVFLYFILRFLDLDILEFKNVQTSYIHIPSFDYNNELNILHNNLATLNHQLEFNKNSSSYKYIVNQIKSLEKEIALKSNSTQKSTNIKDKSYTHLIDFDIFSLSFENRKYLINQIFDYAVWNGTKIKLYIK